LATAGYSQEVFSLKERAVGVDSLAFFSGISEKRLYVVGFLLM
jgi:hypothetical protein